MYIFEILWVEFIKKISVSKKTHPIMIFVPPPSNICSLWMTPYSDLCFNSIKICEPLLFFVCWTQRKPLLLKFFYQLVCEIVYCWTSCYLLFDNNNTWLLPLFIAPPNYSATPFLLLFSVERRTLWYIPPTTICLLASL